MMTLIRNLVTIRQSLFYTVMPLPSTEQCICVLHTPLTLPLTQHYWQILNFRKHCLVCFFKKLFGLQGHRKCPHINNFYVVVLISYCVPPPPHTRWYWWFIGTLHRRNGFYTVQTIFAIAYTNPTPKPTPYRKLCAFLDFPKKNNLVCFFKPSELQGHGQVSS